MQQVPKNRQLLAFLKNFATLRRKRITVYGSGDRVLWLADLMDELPSKWKDAFRSVFSADKPDEMPELWLEIRKKRRPEPPPVPEEIKCWLPEKFLDKPEEYVRRNTNDLLGLLREKITVLTPKKSPEPYAPPDRPLTAPQDVQEERLLQDHPEVEEAWLEYLVNRWESWAQEIHIWQDVQRVYEDVDFMRRRLEEAEERYELVLAIGLLQWRDPFDVTIKRHLLTAPAEISQDAARGVLTVTPAASFDGFRIELDMLELQHQPDLGPVKKELEDLLEELDIRVWDKAKVGKILHIIANRASPDAWVDEEGWKPLERVDKTFRVVFAPALILRERRPTAYDELISRFLEASENEPHFSPTEPWEQFIAEGEASSGLDEVVPADDTISGSGGDRLYFPLDTNEEQKKIAERLRIRPYVLVKGPPGTGKSHTIANLICHLLASGERVLVTAHAPKALAVLHELLPGDIPNLCVMAFGSTRDDQKLLEDSIRRILARKNEWNPQWAQQEIKRLDEELSRLEEERAIIDGQLRQCREAETHRHTLFGGYQGTTAQIARQLERDQETYGWFPDVVNPDSRCPLETSDLVFLAGVHGSLTEERLNELHLEVGDFPLPEPEAFRQTIEALSVAEQKSQALCKAVDVQELGRLQYFPDATLENCKAFLNNLEDGIIRASRVLGKLSGEILKDLLSGQDVRWLRLIQNLEALLAQIKAACEKLGTARVELPKDVERSKLLGDARRRLEHFRKGGRRGFSFFAPQIVRETRYVEESCWVNGDVPRDPGSLEILVTFLELEALIQQFSATCPELANLINQPDLRGAAQIAEELVNELACLLRLFADREQHPLTIIPIHERVLLVELGELQKWLALLAAEMARRAAERAKEAPETWLSNIRSLSDGNLHPCMHELAGAIAERNAIKWKAAWKARERFKEEKECFNHYQELVNRLEQECPGLKSLLNSTCGNPEWRERILRLDQAWAWVATRAWLRQVINKDNYNVLTEQRKEIEKKIEATILRLVELRAWKAFFDRLDERTQQSLIAWQKAMARVGKGTGKYAFKHRRAARSYLRDCIQKIPAWIMPAHKLWDTVTAEVGMFDTIIIDEASQAGIESLILLLLGKRIVVVGDEKQNSPEAVGVLEDDIARLAREHLRDFRFREEFRPDTSLYDHAERAFGNVISLREHFRCVPEIIRFSNDLCYTDAPLIPLRQPPPGRLPPLQVTFVSGGFCEGEGSRLINRVEADQIVRTIQKCLEDEAYKGKTMGVIILQGNAQAELIERKLAEVLEPKEREERKLRCGVPATFQGDQRDVIFLSLVVAPNHSYRALTGLPDQRRFNVAMSRAKDQVWLFHSVRQDELSREDLRWRLLHFFYSPGQGALEELYEEKERLEREGSQRPRQIGTQPDPYESWFEVDVALELLRRGYRVRPQYEVSGYRIDLVIEGLEHRLAVECDGDAWHGPEQYEHDMARQRQLERAGWTFVRIRESEFYANRRDALQLIEEGCKQLKIHPREL